MDLLHQNGGSALKFTNRKFAGVGENYPPCYTLYKKIVHSFSFASSSHRSSSSHRPRPCAVLALAGSGLPLRPPLASHTIAPREPGRPRPPLVPVWLRPALGCLPPTDSSRAACRHRPCPVLAPARPTVPCPSQPRRRAPPPPLPRELVEEESHGFVLPDAWDRVSVR